jgi:hypothetical protein
MLLVKWFRARDRELTVRTPTEIVHELDATYQPSSRAPAVALAQSPGAVTFIKTSRRSSRKNARVPPARLSRCADHLRRREAHAGSRSRCRTAHATLAHRQSVGIQTFKNDRISDQQIATLVMGR